MGYIVIATQAVLLVASAIYCFFYYNPNFEAGARNMLNCEKEVQQNMDEFAAISMHKRFKKAAKKHSADAYTSG